MKTQQIHFFAIFGLASLLILCFSMQVVQGDNGDDEDELEVVGDDQEEEEGEDEDEELEDDEDGPDIESLSVDGQTISYGIPGTDDEFHNQHIPDDFKCDACYILVKKFRETFDKANKKRPSLKKKLPESEIIDLLEEVCDDDFMNVGVKEVNGQKRLSGPGMPIENEPGIMQGGGKWPYRMHAFCMDIVGELGEDVIYGHYLKGDMDTLICMMDYNVCVKQLGKPKRAKPKKEEL